jgi:uncharacterized membrane protein YedE/YeeE
MPILTALIAGCLFGAGLTVAQMVDPQKVLGFLDVAGIAKGTWDPTLMMVFVGALPVMFLAYRLRTLRLSETARAADAAVARAARIDGRLVLGSAVFGIGWGLVGVCPGPAVASLAFGGPQIGSVALFVAAMLAGVAASRLVAPAVSDVNVTLAAPSPVARTGR